MKLPKDHQTVMPYLIVRHAEKVIEFAMKVFNAKETQRHLTDDKRIMHAEIIIEGTTIMMGESNEQWKPFPASLFIYSNDVDGMYQKALQLGGKSIMPVEDKPYGRTCGVEDQGGNIWWITSYPKD
jgi:PhnB protein